MSLWISLHLPTHSLDAVFPCWLTEPLAGVVLDNNQVHALTPAAHATGVLPGMNQSTARILAPQLVFRSRDPHAETQALQQALLCLLQYSPQVTQLDPHTLAIEVSASLRLFGGPRVLRQTIGQALQGLRLNIRLSMAPSALGAWALVLQTQTPRRHVLKLTTLAKQLNPLPIGCLPVLQPWNKWLQSIGCTTLGQLRSLPRTGIKQRTQPKLIQALDSAYGLDKPLYQWITLPDTFSQRYDTWHRLEHTHAIQAITNKLIKQLCGWLQASLRSTRQLIFMMQHEKGRQACPPTRLALELSIAGWQEDDFLPALNEQLIQLVLPQPVIAIELHVSQTEERIQHNPGLFPEPQQYARQEKRLLDLLRARLGNEAVLQACPFASHLPEQANQWRAFFQTQTSQPSRPCARAQHVRPFWLLKTPLALALYQNSPLYKGRKLHLIQGPERIESGWWTQDQHQQRDYFIAQDEQYIRYWIYRERNKLDAQWFLHGFFG